MDTRRLDTPLQNRLVTYMYLLTTYKSGVFYMQQLKGHCLFVCFSFWLRVLDKAVYSAFESTLNSSIVSYRIVSVYTPCPDKNGPPKQNAVKCTIYNTIQ